MELNLKDIFEKRIDRPIDGVIKADDQESILNELEEYVITNEIGKNINYFLQEYNNYSNKNGVWISGFFGSGKSHLLKILSLLLENKAIENNYPSEILSSKISNDVFLKSEIQKTTNIPSKSILFNIDQKAAIISKKEIDALLDVFQSVLDETSGYFKVGYIAKFERDLDKKGLLKEFKEEFKNYSSDGANWEEGRKEIEFELEAVSKAFAKITNQDESACINIVENYRSNYKVSIDDFAKQVKDYIDQKGNGFRLNFFVDEVGQYIADNSKLMVNLQTIAESLNTYCKGKAWIIVTAQEALDKVVGDKFSQQANDFSKIMARFDIRMPLTSQNVAEVIQKRLLNKNEQAITFLKKIYNSESNNFGTLFNFSENSISFRNFKDQEDFLQSYPFIPYQYELFRESIKGLSEHNKFEGKHSSVGERSMLGVFREVVLSISNNSVGELATFDLMFAGIDSALRSSVSSSIRVAENNIGNDLAVRILKILFLVKYYRQFKPTLNNLRVLLIDKFNINFIEFNKSISEALDLLEKQTYIRRINEEYEFLTDEEKDIEEEIKNTEIEISDLQSELSKIIFQRLISYSKIFDESSGNNFNYAKKIDDQLHGQDYDLKINIITPFFESEKKGSDLLFQKFNDDELIVKLPQNNRLFKEIEIYKKTDKYIIQNNRSGIDSIKLGILDQKAINNRERMEKIIIGLKDLISNSTMIIGDKTLELNNNNYDLKLKEGLKILVDKVYYNLSILNNYKYKNEDIKGFYLSAKNGLSPTIAQREILDFINSRSRNSLRVTLKTIEEKFKGKSYGWSENAILSNIAGLIGCKKIELICDGNCVIEEEVFSYLANSRLRINIIVQIKKEVSEEKTETLRLFFKEFFENIPLSKDALDLASEIKNGLTTLNTKLKSYKNQIFNFPFLENYKNDFDLIENLSESNINDIINVLSNDNNFVYIKRNTIDPIIKFIDGNQGKIYKDAFLFSKSNKDNFTLIDSAKSDKLTEILDDPKCFLDNKIPILKKLKVELEEQINLKRKEEIDKTIKNFNKIKTQINSFSGYKDSDELTKSRIKEIFEKNIKKIKDTNIIHSIKAINDYFEDQTLPNILEELDNSDNNKIISSSSIKFENKKFLLESETDVIEYIDSYKNAILNEIKLGNKIKI